MNDNYNQESYNQPPVTQPSGAPAAPPPGKNFLFVPGILYCVFGSFGIIGGIFGMATSGFWDVEMPTFMPWIIYYLFLTCAEAFSIFIGVMGIRHCKNVEKAPTLRSLAFVSIALIIVASIFAMATVPAAMFPGADELTMMAGTIGGVIGGLFGLAFGMVLPILYIIGANKNMNHGASSGSGYGSY